MKIKIVKTGRGLLEFSDGSCILSQWDRECCEYNYADFTVIYDLAKDWEFEHPLTFEASNHGFRFGNPPDRMVFVPCYSEQNWCHVYNINIYYNGKCVLKDLKCDDHEEVVFKQLSLPTTIPLQKNIEPFKQVSLLKHVDMVVGINKTDEE